MNRMTLERKMEFAVGDVQDRIHDVGKVCKAKSVGALVDVALISDDFKEWARGASDAVRNKLDDGRFAISDAIDDADYAMFNDDQGARTTTLIAATAGMAVIAIIVACRRLRRR